MSGSVAGGIKCAATNKEKYGEDWYRKIGAIGGRKPTTKLKGFAANPELARAVGKIGGLKSKRGVKMDDDLYQLKQKLYYARSRRRFYENALRVLDNDYQINNAEKNFDIWDQRVKQYEKEVKKRER